VNGHRLQFTLDIVNLLNMFNHNWGKTYYVSNQNDVPWTSTGIDAATGKIKISWSARANRYALSQLGSRWQIQAGVRYSFD